MDAALKKYRPLLAALLCIASGCQPYQFWVGGPHVITCEILTPLSSVDHNQEMATLHNSGSIDMNYFGATQYLISMNVLLKHGDGLKILMRPVVEYRDVRDSGIIVTATTSGVTIDTGHAAPVTRSDVTLAPDKLVHVWLLSQNNFTQVIVDCDTVFRGWTKRNESDDVVVQALPNSEVQIIQPDWAPIPGE